MTDFKNQDRLRKLPECCETGGEELTRNLINALAVAIVGAAVAFGAMATGVVL
jgi:hypothetical protein